MARLSLTVDKYVSISVRTVFFICGVLVGPSLRIVRTYGSLLSRLST